MQTVTRFLLILLLALAASAAMAACDDKVVDDAGVFGAGIDQVNQAVQALERVGADVRVRTVPSLGGAGNIDRYEAALEKECPSWQAAGGGRNNTLIVFIAAVNDHKVGLYYGQHFKDSLGGQFLRIQTDVMNPHFREHDFTGGFVAGLHEVTTLIQAVSTTTAPAPPPVHDRPPVDLSGLWRVLLGVVVVGGVGAGLFWVSRSVASGQADHEKRRIAQQKAKVSRQSVANLVVRMEGAADPVDALLKTLQDKVPDTELQPLVARLQRARQLITSAVEAYGEADPSAGNPERSGLTVTEYDTMAAGYQKIANDLNEAERLVKDVEGDATALESRMSK